MVSGKYSGFFVPAGFDLFDKLSAGGRRPTSHCQINQNQQERKIQNIFLKPYFGFIVSELQDDMDNIWVPRWYYG